MLMNVCMDDILAQNILLPNLVWLYSIISQSALQENWFTVFSVKATVRVFIIKISFLLYLLNFWSVYNQTWFDSTAALSQSVLLKNGITVFKVKVTAKDQNVNVCPDDIF